MQGVYQFGTMAYFREILCT